MKFYKIFSTVKEAWWQQDKYGYTDEHNAGYWSEPEITGMTLDDEQRVIEYTPTRLQLVIRDNCIPNIIKLNREC